MDLETQASNVAKAVDDLLVELATIGDIVKTPNDIESGRVRLDRWVTRVIRTLEQRISMSEAQKFTVQRSRFASFDIVDNFRRQITQYREFLSALIEDLDEHPQDVLTNIENTAPNVNSEDPIQTPLSSKVFVVHGHDEEMKQAAARTLERLGLEPIILHEQPDQGRTIIEKFEDYSDVGFAVVLLSPDDMGYSRNESAESAKPRARQNVILELGFFVGKLGRSNVFVLFKNEDNFEIPSDYSGVIYQSYDGGSGAWRFELVQELSAAGYEVDANKLLKSN